MDRRVYLDHNATTPVRPEVRRAMEPALRGLWGNPSSVHAAGREARDAVERARAEVAGLLGAQAEEIIFTSGGTEGDHLAITGLAHAARRAGRGAHVISSPLEHPAVLGALDALRRDGFAVTLLPVGGRGEITPGDLAAASKPDTVLVSLAAANHEIGNCFDVRALAAVARAGDALFHTDAVQAAGKIPLDVAGLGVDALTISAHKMEGPKGVGALYVRRGVDLDPLIAGGHQERERRPGTENVAGILGLGAACRLVSAERRETGDRLERLRDRLEARLLALSGARLHGDDAARRLPGTSNLAFAGAPGELVMAALDLEGICVSTGAACTSGTIAPSPVLLALGLPAEAAREGVRFSLGRNTTAAEIDRCAEVLPTIVDRVRRAVARPAGPASSAADRAAVPR